MNSPIFHEIFNAIVAKINDLRPKVSIFFKEINAKLDAKGKYTKKIVWSFIGLVTVWKNKDKYIFDGILLLFEM